MGGSYNIFYKLLHRFGRPRRSECHARTRFGSAEPNISAYICAPNKAILALAKYNYKRQFLYQSSRELKRSLACPMCFMTSATCDLNVNACNERTLSFSNKLDQLENDSCLSKPAHAKQLMLELMGTKSDVPIETPAHNTLSMLSAHGKLSQNLRRLLWV